MKRQICDYSTLVGQKFGPDDRLEVLALNPIIPYCRRTIAVRCSECAKDPEMYGGGVYNFDATAVKNKTAICGCSRNYSHSMQQNTVRFRRLCESKNMTFMGFKGEYKGANSVLIVKCNVDGYEWAPQVQAFLKQTVCTRCAKRGSETHRESTSRLIKRFMATGSYPEGTEFVRHNEPGLWSLICPTCSHNGERFKTTLPQLSNGARPCNCAPKVFEPDANYKLYVLRVCSDAYDFTGYGISRVFDSRLSQHRKNLASAGFQISEMETFDMLGSEALKIEGMIGKAFPRFSQPVSGFIKEASYYWLYDDILRFVEDRETELRHCASYIESV